MIAVAVKTFLENEIINKWCGENTDHKLKVDVVPNLFRHLTGYSHHVSDCLLQAFPVLTCMWDVEINSARPGIFFTNDFP
jgi:hypothetical protein